MNALATTTRDLVLLVARAGLGVLMLGHAKVAYDYSGSVGGLIDAFRASGVPLPALTAPANLFGEILGGVAMIVGLAVPLVGVLMAVNMVGAWAFVHTSGLYAADRNGPEFVIAVGLLSLVLAVTGSGRLGLDHLLAQRRAHAARSDAVDRVAAASGPSS
jgi:putative oxidoreductase